MAKLFCLLNHSLTDAQNREISEKLQVSKVEIPPSTLKILWENISPEGELKLNSLNRLVEWLRRVSNPGDYVLVQGEFGATYYIVDFCFENDLIPIYATSKRVYSEKNLSSEDVLREHLFKHVNFRKYVRWRKID